MSQSKLYVGNLSYSTTDQDLQEYFSQYGTITEVKLITDRETGRSKGFGFVNYETDDFAKEALKADGTELQGRKIRVNIANDDRRTGGGVS